MSSVSYLSTVECHGVAVSPSRISHLLVASYSGGRTAYVIHLQGNDSHQSDSGSTQECISSYMVIKHTPLSYSMLYYTVNKIHYVLLHHVIHKYSLMFIKYTIQLYVHNIHSIYIFIKYTPHLKCTYLYMYNNPAIICL